LPFQRFIEKWANLADPPVTVVESDLDAVEARFGFTLPHDYRQAILAHGVPSVNGGLLDGMLAAELSFPDVSEFFAPEEIIRLTDEWRGGGMPDHLVGIAFDCGGSLFCFDASPGADSGAVLFWNHDSGVATATADGFTAWIDRFCAVESAPEGWAA
jgi:hypothetical protein